jgi:hypothetical protein
MCDQKPAVRFRHHFLASGSVLTVCTRLDYETRNIDVGWSLFNHEDRRWVRRFGNQMARERMDASSLKFSLTSDEPILCDYISMRALMLIFVAAKRESNHFQEGTPQIIPRTTLAEIQFEIFMMLNLLGQRVGLRSIFEA